METQVTIPDGVYFLHPEGCCWLARRYRGGRVIGGTEEHLAGTHQAARDQWADVVPTEEDVEVDDDLRAAILIGCDCDPEDSVVVTRAGDDRQ